MSEQVAYTGASGGWPVHRTLQEAVKISTHLREPGLT